MFKCEICNKKFDKILSLNAHKSSHSKTREEKRNIKKQNYENHIDKISDKFLDNKYTKIYYRIISKARKTTYSGYTEKHHVLPRSLGGEDDFLNLVKLSPREHFLCHYLLTKMLTKNTNEYNKIIHAFIMMKGIGCFHNRYFNNRLYDGVRQKISLIMKQKMLGDNNPSSGTMWIYNFSDKQSIKIKKDEFENYKKLGWKKGRISNFELYDSNEKYISKNKRKTKMKNINFNTTKNILKNVVKHNKLKNSEKKKETLLPKTKYKAISICESILNKTDISYVDYYVVQRFIVNYIYGDMPLPEGRGFLLQLHTYVMHPQAASRCPRLVSR